jgi:hypothetical protein
MDADQWHGQRFGLAFWVGLFLGDQVYSTSSPARCRAGPAVVGDLMGLIPTSVGGYFKRWRPASVRLTECAPPEIRSQPRSTP